LSLEFRVKVRKLGFKRVHIPQERHELRVLDVVSILGFEVD
jgi:hypothetical protein